MAGYTSEDAEEMIKAARGTIELECRSPRFDPKIIEKQFSKYTRKENLLVRLIHYPTSTIRGTSEILNQEPLIKGIISGSMSAAFGIHNTAPVSSQELDELIIEINILSDSVKLGGSFINKRNEIDTSKHGILVRYGSRSGMVLPSYAMENNLDKTGFLEAASMAAGLGKDYWKQPNVSVYVFEVQRIWEESPNGKVKISHASK